VGRERELAGLAAVLRDDRLITLHGPGGAGKTRLAIELADRGHGEVLFGDLGRLAPGTDVWGPLAQLTGAQSAPGEPTSDAVERALRDQALLLVLDNCEHVLPGAREVATQLLATCDAVTLLVTSREPLGLASETVWPVPPLSLPPEAADLAETVAHDAARLFTERAARALPGFRLRDEHAAAVGRICRRLDGIPLAIELAAARVNVLGPEDIAERLDDRFALLARADPALPPRQRTLRALVDWSYELLTGPERLLLARLAVFAGGFEPDAVEQVATGGMVERREVIDLLGGLVDKALVARGERSARSRLRLHETIREYAAERLAAGDDAEVVRRRHLEWCRELAATLDDTWLGAGGDAQFERARAEEDNVRAALAWGLGSGRAEAALELAWRFGNFWGTLGRPDEARVWLERGLEATAGAQPSVDRARALTRAGTYWEAIGDWARARSRHEASLAMGIAVDDAVREGVALLALADVDRATGRLADARSRAEEGLRAIEPTGDRERVRWLVEALGRIDLAGGDAAAARERFAASRAEAVALGNATSLAWTTRLLGEAEREAGDRVAARMHLEEALGLARRRHDREAEAVARLSLGRLELAAGAMAEAHTQLTDALRLAERAGTRPVALDCMEALAELHASIAAGSHTDRAAAETAAALLGAVAALREALGTPPEPRERARLARLDAELEEALGPEPYAAVQGTGRAGSWADAVDAAMRAPAPTRQPAPGEPIEVLLHRDGDIWALSRRGCEVHLRDSKGLHYLAALIAAAGRDVHVLELAGSPVDERGAELLDDAARAAYRARLAELEEELDEARRFADPERAALLDDERGALFAELRGAVGLGGRARSTSSSAERARKAVTNRLRDALARVEREDPELAAHLRGSLRMGSACAYRPEPHSRWSLHVA
jgi:predicted ATPase